MNPDTEMNDNSKISEENSRKMILESYEKAGVDLPLVELETVLDREISEDDARQTGAPRFRKFLDKATRALSPKTVPLEEGPDDEVAANASVEEEGPDDEIGANSPPVLSSSSYTSNSNAEYDTASLEPAEIPQTPDRAANVADPPVDPEAIIPATPESMKNDCHPTFDFCCPKTSNESPARTLPTDKYVMSNMQLAEALDGFDDEHQSVDVQDVEEARDAPALMDVDDSMLDESYKMELQGDVSKGSGGIMSFFRGSRRFRFATAFCCFLHLVLIGLIIAFVTDNQRFNAGSSSAQIPGGQGATAPPSENTANEVVPSKPLLPESDLQEESEPAVVETTAPSIVTNSTTSPINTVEEDNVSDEEITVQNATQTPTEADEIFGECIDLLQVSESCVGEDTELYVYFESCNPLPGDWVAIYPDSVDPQALSDTDWIGWMYTCGDRLCEETVQNEVLSFTRAKDRADTGNYRAHLIREGDGPIFTSIASSPAFRIAGAGASC